MRYWDIWRKEGNCEAYHVLLLLFIITKDHHALNMKSQSMSVAQTIQKRKNTEKWITVTNFFALDCCDVFSIVCVNVAQ